MESQPSVLQLVKWLTSHTRDVHKPLYVSTLFASSICRWILCSLPWGQQESVAVGHGKWKMCHDPVLASRCCSD